MIVTWLQPFHVLSKHLSSSKIHAAVLKYSNPYQQEDYIVAYMKRPICPCSWEDEAAQLLAEIKGPKMIVVDLDFTLWPTNFAEHTLPPYICLDDMTGAPASTVLCVDRITRKPRVLSLYKEVRRTIEWCVQQGLQLSICSKSTDYDGAEMILSCLGLWDLFQHPQIYGARKTFHFRNLRACTNMSYSDFLFFDDDCKNIELCSSMGVNCSLVDKAVGFDGPTLLGALRQYSRSEQVAPPSAWTVVSSKRLRRENTQEERESPFSFQ